MEFAQTAKEWGVRPIIGAEVTLHGRRAPDAARRNAARLRQPQPPAPHAHLSSPRGEPRARSGGAARPHRRPDRALRLPQGRGLALHRSGRLRRGACGSRALRRDSSARDNFFIELQDNLVHGDRARNRGLVELARELGLGVVATNNVHYHDADAAPAAGRAGRGAPSHARSTRRSTCAARTPSST